MALTPTQKLRRYRQRQRAGVAVLRIPVDLHPLLEALIESRHVTVGEALDRQQVEQAAGKVLMEWVRLWEGKSEEI